jgi:hypothetical protein
MNVIRNEVTQSGQRLRYRLEDRRIRGQETFLLSITPRQALMSTHPHIQWVPVAASSEAKLLVCEPYSPASRAEARMVALYRTPIYLYGMVLN